MRTETITLESGRTFTRAYPAIGERVPVVGCYSEAFMHLGAAGRNVEVALVHDTNLRGDVLRNCRPVAQLYEDGQPRSFPVLYSEAGFYQDDSGEYYTYLDL